MFWTSYVVNNPTSAGYSSEAQQFIDRLNPDPGTTRKDLYAELIDALVAAGAWTGIDVLQVYAADSEANAVRNLKSATPSATPVNSPTFTIDEGYTGAFVGGKYVNTGFNASTFGGNYTQNAACLGAWSLTATLGNEGIVGGFSAATGQTIYPKHTGSTYMRINDNPETGGFANGSDTTGFYFGVRTGANGRTGYRNGVSIGDYGGDDPSQAPNNTDVTVPTAESALATNGQVACFIAGGNLDSQQGAI